MEGVEDAAVGANEEDVPVRRAHSDRKRKPPPVYQATSSTELTKQLRAAQREAEEAEAAQLQAEEAANAPFDTAAKAAAVGGLAAVEAWLEGAGHVDAREGKKEATLLMVASGAGQEKMVELLVGRGADLDVQGTYGCTALITAAAWGRAAIVSALLHAGARTDLTDVDGWTALKWAEGRAAEPVLTTAQRRGCSHAARLLRQHTAAQP